MPRFTAFALACLIATPSLADWDKAKLDAGIAAIEREAKGRLGVALLDLKDRRSWSHRGTERFPLQSVFKLPLAVAVLQAVEAGKLKLDQPVAVTRKDLSLYHSPLRERFKGERQDVRLSELVRLAAAESDNSAADLLMRMVGGPQVVTAMLKAGGVAGISIDRYERVFQPEILGLPGYGWDEVIDTKAFSAKVVAIPAAERRRKLEATLADARDSATPEASAAFLEALAVGNWLREPAHNRLVEAIAAGAKTGRERIRAGLPKDAQFAHKTGLGPSAAGLNHATNDIGVVTLLDGRRFAIAVYLAGSTAEPPAREAAHAAVARLAVAALR
jgi:beta-lactamase class A